MLIRGNRFRDGYCSIFFSVLVTFAESRKLTINFDMSVFMEQLCSHWTDFPEISYLKIFFFEICRENSSLIKI